MIYVRWSLRGVALAPPLEDYPEVVGGARFWLLVWWRRLYGPLVSWRSLLRVADAPIRYSDQIWLDIVDNGQHDRTDPTNRTVQNHQNIQVNTPTTSDRSNSVGAVSSVSNTANDGDGQPDEPDHVTQTKIKATVNRANASNRPSRRSRRTNTASAPTIYMNALF